MSNSYMNPKALNHIGLNEVLKKLQVLSPYGRTEKEGLKPYLPHEIDALNQVLDELTDFTNELNLKKDLIIAIKNNLLQYKDIRGTLQRIRNGEVLNVIELFEVKGQAMEVREVIRIIEGCKLKNLPSLQGKAVDAIIKLLDPQDTGIKTFYLYDSYSEELSHIRLIRKELEEKISVEKALIKQRIINTTGCKPKLNGEIAVDKQEKEKIYVLSQCQDLYQSSETFKNVIFTVKASTSLEELENKLMKIKMQEEDKELEVRQYLSRQLRQYIDVFQHNISVVGKLDLLLGKYYLTIKIKGVRPLLSNHHCIEIKGGRHIIVEEILKKKGKEFTPIDIIVNTGVTLITGANMGGKTVVLKLVALITVMAQMGLYVPAEMARVSPREFIYLSLGDQQSVEAGLSSFGGEIHHLKDVLQRGDENGLILMDELARGTNPREGYAISKGVMEYLKGKNSITLITSHFDGLSKIKNISHLQVMGLKKEKLLEEEAFPSSYKEGLLEEYMDYRLKPVDYGKEVPMDAIFIARILGLPKDILMEAEEALKNQE